MSLRGGWSTRDAPRAAPWRRWPTEVWTACCSIGYPRTWSPCTNGVRATPSTVSHEDGFRPAVDGDEPDPTNACAIFADGFESGDTLIVDLAGWTQ